MRCAIKAPLIKESLKYKAENKKYHYEKIKLYKIHIDACNILCRNVYHNVFEHL